MHTGGKLFKHKNKFSISIQTHAHRTHKNRKWPHEVENVNEENRGSGLII
jgi:hypothetical protein